MQPNGMSSKEPSLRIAWDATALKAYMRDPLAYYWQYVQGYQSVITPAPLLWGTLWHEVTRRFKQTLYESRAKRGALAPGEIGELLTDRDQALLIGVQEAIALATAANMNDVAASGRKGDLKTRNLYTLIRSLIWWEAEYRDDDVEVVSHEGKPLLEQHFTVPLGMKASTGEDYLLCGSWDEVVEDEDGQFILERKSTTTTLSDYYFLQFDPDVQIYTYDLVGSFMLPDNPLKGVVVEACQTVVGFSRFMRHEVFRTPEQRKRWLATLKYWIDRAEQDALNASWTLAMNCEASIFESAYKQVQRRTPSHWKSMLESEMERRPLWNPLQPHG